MSDIIIKNLELPEEGLHLIVYPDGRVLRRTEEGVVDVYRWADAKILPDHGDLIDRDKIEWGYDPHFDTLSIMIDRLYEQPVVIFHLR